MPASERSAPQTVLWCLLLPLAERLPLTADEQALLRREIRRSNRIGYLLAPVFPIGFPIGLFLLTDPHVLGLPAVWGWVLLAGFLFSAVLPLYIANLHLQRANKLNRDLRGGEKWRFVGALIPPIFDLFVRRNLLDERQRSDQQTLDVLPVSHRLWRLNGAPLPKWMDVEVAEATEQPESASIAAQWLDPIGEIKGVAFSGGRRELSAEEKTELRRLARRSWLRPLFPVLGVSAWCYFLVSFSRDIGRPLNTGMQVFLLLTIGFDLLLLWQIRLAYLLHRDIAYGWVHILRAEMKGDSAGEAEGPTVERFHFSRKFWTMNGKPAPWRTQQ